VVKAFAAAAKALNVPLAVIQDSRAGERERYESALVLVRPDQFRRVDAQPWRNRS